MTGKLVLAFLLVSVMPLGVIIWVSHQSFTEHAERQVGTRLDDSVGQAGKGMDEFMLSCLRSLKNLAEDPDLTSGRSDLTGQRLERYADLFPNFREVMLVNTAGTIVASSRPARVGTALFARFNNLRNDFAQALRNPSGAVYVSDLTNAPDSLNQAATPAGLVGVTLPIQMLMTVRDAGGHEVDVLVGDLLTSPLHGLLQDLKRDAPEDGSACLLDEAGRVLMSTDPQAHLLSVHPDLMGSTLRASLGKHAGGYLVYGSPHGRKRIAVHTRLQAYGANQAGNWRLVLFVPYDAVLEPVTGTFRRIMGILCVTLGAAIGMGVWMARRLAEPVLRLTEGAKTIAAGRFDARVSVTTRDEIGVLADAFNQMAGTLEQGLQALRSANDLLEQRVEERTAQLSAEIAERRKAEEIMRESEAQLNAYFESSPTGMVMWDPELRYLKVNQQVADLTGASIEEHIGKTVREMLPLYASQVESIAQEVFATGEPVFNVDRSGPNLSGEILHWQSSYFPLQRENGAIRTIGAVTVNVTALKRVEQELLQAKAAAEGASRAKSEFLANMSHEIRTPMNGVIGMTGLLLDGELQPEQRAFAETIRASAEALLTIINDILDFSKIEAGKLTFELLDFELVDTVESTLDLLAERAQAKGTELASAIAPDLPTGLRGDPGRLRQILTNLIGNALKFTEKGEVVVRVSKESETEKHVQVHFRVEDSGLGIASEVQGKLFQAFSQADGSTTRRYGGTGLGLAIAKQLVVLMDGEIGVESEPGKGSTFWFTGRFAKQAGSVVLADACRYDLSDLRVLAVDDNAANRQILRHQLTAWKMHAGSAAGGREALECLQAAAKAGQAYHLALLDVQMPEMDGLALARAIQGDLTIAGTRLIVLTSFGQSLGPAELAAAGIEACLVKPVKQSRLFDCVASAMGHAVLQNAVLKPCHPGPAALGSKPCPPLATVRILLAEDNRINQRVALGQLRKMGYRADAVANGEEVLAAFRQLPYDIILMDCQMPEMDGYEATRAIRQWEQRDRLSAPVHIIAMTANAMQGDRERCLAAGMNDYVSKPVRAADLQAALERGLGSLGSRLKF